MYKKGIRGLYLFAILPETKIYSQVFLIGVFPSMLKIFNLIFVHYKQFWLLVYNSVSFIKINNVLSMCFCNYLKSMFFLGMYMYFFKASIGTLCRLHYIDRVSYLNINITGYILFDYGGLFFYCVLFTFAYFIYGFLIYFYK